MKAKCRRTYFLPPSEKPIFEKNKFYKIDNRNSASITVISEIGINFYLSTANYHKYFIDVEQLREDKINEILNG